jgi:hypothetical protein
VLITKAIQAYLESGGKRGGFEPRTIRTYRDALDTFESSVPVKLTR